MGLGGHSLGHVVGECQFERPLTILIDGWGSRRLAKLRGSSGTARLLDTKERDVLRAASSAGPLASAASSQWLGISW